MNNGSFVLLFEGYELCTCKLLSSTFGLFTHKLYEMKKVFTVKERHTVYCKRKFSSISCTDLEFIGALRFARNVVQNLKRDRRSPG